MALGNLITTTAASISSGGTINGNLTIEGDLTVNGDGSGNYDEIVDGNLAISSTNKLVLGGDGSDTYLQESGADVLDIYVGGANMIKLTESTTDTMTVTGALTIGSDGSGHDVTFHSGTSGDSFVWDASEEKLTITGTNGQTALDIADGNLVVADNIDLEGDIDVNGTANLDIVDIDGAVNMAADLTSTADIIIDANDKALVLGADQDASIFSNNAGEIFFVRGQDYSPAAGDVEGWIAMTLGNSSDTILNVMGGEGGSAQVILHSDGGDDDADKWKLNVADGGAFTMNYATTGAYVDHFNMSSTGAVFNEDSADLDFRVESNGNTHALVVDGAQGFVGLGASAPGYVNGNDHRGGNTNTSSGAGGLLHIEGLVPRIILDDTGDTPQYAIEGQDYFSILELADGSTSETTLLRITSGGDVGINTTSAGYGGNSNNQYLSILNSDTTDDADRTAILELATNNKGDGVRVGAIDFWQDVDGGDDLIVSIIGAQEGTTSNNVGGKLRLQTKADGGSLADRLVITEAGKVGIGTDSPGSNQLRIQQDSNSVALYIDNNGTDSGIELSNTGSTGRGIYAYTNQGSSANNALIHAYADHADFDQPALLIQQDGAGRGMKIDQNGNMHAIDIDSESTTQWVINVEADALTTRGMAMFYSNSSDTNARNLVGIYNDHASASSATGLLIDQDANAISMNIDSEATTNHTMTFTGPAQTTGFVISMSDTNALTTGSMAYFHSNSSTTNSRKLVNIVNDHASATGATGLYVQQDSTGLAAEFSGGSIKINNPPDVGGIELADGDANASPRLMFTNDTSGEGCAIYNSEGTLLFCTSGSALQSSSGTARMKIDANSQLFLSNEPAENTGNTIFGYSAMNAGSNNGSDHNTVVGHLAMGTGTVNGATNNVAVGYRAGDDVTSGDNSVYIGYAAGDSCADVDSLVAVGYDAIGGGGTTTDAADGTVAVGKSALASLTSGSGNVAVGYAALDAVEGGSHNTAVGYDALTTAAGNASHNTAVGRDALKTWNVNGDGNNTAMGSEAGSALTTGVSCVLVGAEAGKAAQDVDGLVLVGDNAGKTLNSSNADNTIAVGRDALTALTSGNGNVAVGAYALDAMTIGDNNIAMGIHAGGAIDSSDGNDDNTFLGVGAGMNATDADQSTLVGYSSGRWYGGGTGNNATGRIQHCTFVGQHTSGSSNTPTNQTVIGHDATGQADNSVTLGNTSVTDVYMSQDAGATVRCGAISIGRGTTNPTLGTLLHLDGSADDREVVIIEDADETVIQSGDTLLALRFGADENCNEGFFIDFKDQNGSIGDVRAHSGGTSVTFTSDYRVKENMSTLSGGLEKINKLKPILFNFIDYPDVVHEGFLAHEVQDAGLGYAVFGEKDAVKIENKPSNKDFGKEVMDKQHMSNANLIPQMVNAIQELSAKVEELEAKLK